eukprot:3938722-Rhodomonas_salina.1
MYSDLPQHSPVPSVSTPHVWLSPAVRLGIPVVCTARVSPPVTFGTDPPVKPSSTTLQARRTLSGLAMAWQVKRTIDSEPGPSHSLQVCAGCRPSQ